MSENPARHLSTAAEGVRTFNHTSQAPSEDWEFPIHTYKALGSLSRLVEMLGQAIEQSTRPVMRTHEHGRVLIDAGGDADQKVIEMLAACEDAVAAAGELTEAIQRMHNATSPMGLDTEGMPEFADDGQD
jgi:hypothetical protein